MRRLARGDFVSDVTRKTCEELDQLLQNYLRRARESDQISVTEFADLYPRYASQLRELLPAMLAVERIAERPPELGKRIGDYRLVRVIGRGGMGVVYEAVQESLGRSVALKVLPHLLVGDSDAEARFAREAQAVAQLTHENIVRVYEFGVVEATRYFSMPLISGQTLGVAIADLNCRQVDSTASTLVVGPEKNPSVARESQYEIHSPVDDTVAKSVEPQDAPHVEPYTEDHRRLVTDVGIQVAEALEHAHKHGVIHRDIKPSNIMVDSDGKAWVMDFGLARTAASDLTRTGVILGTLRYMAPEQFEGIAHPQSDTYSLGVVLHELATLQPAVETDDRVALKRLVGKPKAISEPRTIVAAIPRSLNTVIAQATAPDPVDRYQTARDLAADLRRVIDGQYVSRRHTKATTRNRWIAVVLSAVIAALAWLAVSNLRRPQEDTVAPILTESRILPGNDRDIATWVLSRGGSVDFLTEERTSRAMSVDELPHVPFNIITIDLSGYQKLTRQHIEDCAKLPAMTEWLLSESNFQESWLPILRNAQEPSSLQLADCGITDAGSAVIGELRSLNYLGLNSNQLTDKGVQALAGLTDLSELTMNNNPELTGNCLSHLSNMQLLDLLDVEATQVTTERAQEFERLRKRRMRDFRVVW